MQVRIATKSVGGAVEVDCERSCAGEAEAAAMASLRVPSGLTLSRDGLKIRAAGRTLDHAGAKALVTALATTAHRGSAASEAPSFETSFPAAPETNGPAPPPIEYTIQETASAPREAPPPHPDELHDAPPRTAPSNEDAAPKAAKKPKTKGRTP